MIKNLALFHKHVVGCYPQEAVGLLIDNIFYPKENIHEDPINNFALSKEASLEAARSKASILHSHTFISRVEDARTPSYEDMKGRQATNLPWGIVHCDGKNVSDILYFGGINNSPLEGRYYISNVYDCFTLTRDFIYNYFAYDIGLHPRPPDWETWNPHYITQQWDKLEFKAVSGDLQYGDILLFSIGRYLNHMGIYTGEGKFLHHVQHRLSCFDTLSKWERQFVKAIRHTHAKTQIL